jgi:hypothetical protein
MLQLQVCGYKVPVKIMYKEITDWGCNIMSVKDIHTVAVGLSLNR